MALITRGNNMRLLRGGRVQAMIMPGKPRDDTPPQPVFSPADLFAAGEPGIFLDSSDFSSLFQDAAGTIPVTAVEQPVGLILDKSGVPNITVYGATTIDTATGSFGTVLSPDNAFLYSSDTVNNTVRMYSRNTSTGALTSLTPASIASGSGTRGLAMSPDGAHVYCCNLSANTISQYSRNPTTGVLTALETPTVATGIQPFQTIVSPEGTHVYVINYGGTSLSQYSRNSSTGELTALTPATVSIAANAYDIAITGDGTSVYTVHFNSSNPRSEISQFSRNPTTGVLTALSPATVGAGANPMFISIAPDGTSLYATCDSNVVSQYSRNTSTGALTALATRDIASGTGPRGIVVTSNGTTVYVANTTAKTLSQYSRNTSTGALTSLGAATAVFGFAVGKLIISANQLSLYASSSGVAILKRSLIGNHAYQNTTTSRPILRQEAGGQYYLEFDGTDDWLTTGNIDFSATDKMSVFAGAHKLSDSQQRIIAELSVTIASNNGSFMLSGPNSAASNYNFSSKGTSQVDNTVTAYAAPISNVITGLADIAAPTNTIRINQVATTLNTSQGTGNYGNFPLYIGRRGGTTLPFRGRLYSLIIRGALTSSPQLEQTEQWIAAKTGVTL